jgi:hypothetical protein
VSSFEVLTGSLLSGASAIGAAPTSVGLGGVSGAAAQTPAAGAWSGFVARADRALANGDEVCGDLARALRDAAQAYEIADQATAASMGTGE